MTSREALVEFMRAYLSDFGDRDYDATTAVDFVVNHLHLSSGGDVHELINWYEQHADDLRREMGVESRKR